MKGIVSILLILTMLFSSFAIMSSAAVVDDDYGVMPCFTTISSVATSFTISGLNSISTVVLTAKTSTSLYIKKNHLVTKHSKHGLNLAQENQWVLKKHALSMFSVTTELK